MAFTNFYVDSSGNDMNAGTVINSAAAVVTTNGDWNNAVANRFTAASGTPFSAVSIGDWASIYIDGVTAGLKYIAQVTAVNSGGASIDVSSTAKYGAAIAASATARSCRIGGSWTSELAFVATGLSGSVPASTKINIKAGTYTIVASRAISLSGIVTGPLWLSGYNTTPGDLDSDVTNGLTKPLLAFNATFSLSVSGMANGIMSGLSITGNVSNRVVEFDNTTRIVRVRIENTSSNAAAFALTMNGSNTTLLYCWCKAPATATSNGVVLLSNGGTVIGSVVEGGGKASFDMGSSNLQCVAAVSLNSGGAGFLATTSQMQLTSCTVSNATGDGVKWTGTPNTAAWVIGCLFRICGGYGIDNASGTNANTLRTCNDFYSCTSGQENGFGDSPAWFGQTDSSDPATSGTNMTPVFGSNARNNGFPGIFENESFSSYQDIGAVRHSDPVITLPRSRVFTGF